MEEVRSAILARKRAVANNILGNPTSTQAPKVETATAEETAEETVVAETPTEKVVVETKSEASSETHQESDDVTEGVEETTAESAEEITAETTEETTEETSTAAAEKVTTETTEEATTETTAATETTETTTEAIAETVVEGAETADTAEVIEKGTETNPLSVEIQEDNLSKSHLIDAFTYGEDKLKVGKKGSEIKAKLGDAAKHYQSCMDEHATKMAACVTAIGSAPMEESDEYGMQYTKAQKDLFIPKRYSYSQRYPEDSSEETSTANGAVTAVVTPTALSKEVKKEMNDYNNYLYKYKSCANELGFIRSLAGSLEDKKSYSLTIKQVASLGL